MHTIYLALGTNLGDKESNLQIAIEKINDRVGKVSVLSSILKTEPWGFESAHLFLNMVICVQTQLSPTEILTITQTIEKEIGRNKKSTQMYEDRVIDIDLIMYSDLVMKNDELTLPHPLFHTRLFVLKPLAEIAPDLVHPVLKKTIRELLELEF